ncbi:MAG: alpha-glucan family phosphorylase [Burkholderiales bacterium]|nr:alpha-glucan family phosphorylase [Burkholderiales bacterium]
MQRSTAQIIEVKPKIPARLARLEELANNLWYSWDKPTRTLFARLHPGLWDSVGHNPKAFLKRIDEHRLNEAADDPVFLGNFNRVLSEYDTYHNEPLRRNGSEWLRQNDTIAYFCAEFGFHESFPIYSGGLGILAGDHCKSASDIRLPLVGVGLLYRQGYFHQTIDHEGRQQAAYSDSDFDDLPITPVTRADGADLHVRVELPGRDVAVKVWRARVGHIKLFLLDTDLEENSTHDRDIAHRLYGGDRSTRIEQEIVLGIGGVRALNEMNILPSVWHINEGHAAFMLIERMRKLVSQGLDFPSALEAVAVNTVFTTHTPVAAGHDHFDRAMISSYFERYCADLKIGKDEFFELGHAPGDPDFNMTALAIHVSRFHNGVSRIHGGVSSQNCSGLWPQIEPQENPINYITNGVHVPTFLAQEWADLFERFLGFEWTHKMSDRAFWQRIIEIPDHLFWSMRQALKSQMLDLVRHRVAEQHYRNHGSEAHLERLLKFADPVNPSVLVIGFARRFATYKRATLLFDNLEWLREIIGDPKRPVLFIFAGKAHPADEPGQALIRRLTQISRMPEFEGRLLLLEGYDMRLARRLVSGVDVWLNNPVYPLEASGTSGIKAGINGVINLSVLDGWWGEGYDGLNGWAIKPASQKLDDSRRNAEEGQTLYEILQDQVLPLYYQSNNVGYSPGWVAMAKHSIASLLPRFSSARMVAEYLSKFYLPATQQGRRYAHGEFANARLIAAWKSRVRAAWPGVVLRGLNVAPRSIAFGESLRFDVAIKLNGLKSEDVVIEMLVARQSKLDKLKESTRHRFESTGVKNEAGEDLFALELTPKLCGKLEYRIRVYPHHELLTHPLEMGMMLWL